MNLAVETNEILNEIQNTLKTVVEIVQKNTINEYQMVLILTEKKITFYKQYPPNITALQQVISIYLLFLHNPMISDVIVNSINKTILLLPKTKSNQLFLERFLLCLLPISFNKKPQVIQNIVHLINNIPLMQILPSITPLMKSDLSASECFIDVVLTTISKAKTYDDISVIDNTIKQLLFYLTPSTKKRASNELRTVTFKIFQEIIVNHYSFNILNSMKELFFYDLPSTLFKYLLYPIIFKDSFSQQSIILLTKLFSLGIKDLKGQFECYWTYLLNALDFVLHENEEVIKFLTIESTCEIIFTSLLTISSLPGFGLLLFNNYDCDIFSSNLLQDFLQTLNSVGSLKPTPKSSKIQLFFVQLYMQILKSLRYNTSSNNHINIDIIKKQFHYKQLVLNMLKEDISIPQYFSIYSKITSETENIASMIYHLPLIDRSKITKYLFDKNNKRECSIFLLLCCGDDVLESFFEVLRRINIPDDILMRKQLIEDCSLLFANKHGETEESVLEEYKEMFGLTLELYQKYWNDKMFLTTESLKRYAKSVSSKIVDNGIQTIVDGVFKNCPYFISTTPPIKPMRHIKRYLFTKEKFCNTWKDDNQLEIILEVFEEWYNSTSNEWHNWDVTITQNLVDGNSLLASYSRENQRSTFIQKILLWEMKESEILDQYDILLNSIKSLKAIVRFAEILVTNYEYINEWKDISEVYAILISNNVISPKDTIKNTKRIIASVFKRRKTIKRKIQSVDTNKCVQKIMSVIPLKLKGEQINGFLMAILNNLVNEKNETMINSYHILIQHIVCLNINRLEIFWEQFLLSVLSFCLKENGINNGKIVLTFVMSLIPFFFQKYISKHTLVSSFFLFVACLDQKHFELIKDKTKIMFDLLFSYVSSIDQQSIPSFIQMCLKKYPESFVVLTRPFITITDQITLQIIIKDMKNIYVVIGTLDYFEFSIIVMRRIFSFAPFPFHPAVPLFQELCDVVKLQFDCVLSKKEGPEIFRQFFTTSQMIFKYYSAHIPSSFYLVMVDIAYKKSIEFKVDSLHKMYLLTFIVRFFIDNFKRIDSIHNASTIPDFISLIIQMTDIDDENSRKNSSLMLKAFFTMLKRFYPDRIDLLKQMEELKKTLPSQISSELDLISLHDDFSPNAIMIDDDMYASTPRSSLDLNRNDIKKS
ncbi:hypothetical protein EDI_310670 [Entamoeba dispar SAW760]|uniref:Uncharacterized protein n=1 Tax=Entamoeba dispar (strain ATCC PRA-260 / SAW760) TaxID=370354 RepID=B0E8H1_ENTDS|nr:uncharacterized protein EDI_310670 [Entamoeba dispar SAW760]EDR29173.1 hypothetical protein EDI_310670 [Entamoeba dispar SAW760]|eukprot:EDR29173.1 hypothetical protein EDI_310670 [Entamoeba dispar SAW760]